MVSDTEMSRTWSLIIDCERGHVCDERGNTDICTDNDS